VLPASPDPSIDYLRLAAIHAGGREISAHVDGVTSRAILPHLPTHGVRVRRLQFMLWLAAANVFR